MNKTVVWWDMHSTPVPDGCDPRCVRQSIDSALKKFLGSDQVTIHAMGNIRRISYYDQEGITSSGIAIRHIEFGLGEIIADMHSWARSNPPQAATMIFISDVSMPVECGFKRLGYKFIRPSYWTCKSLLNDSIVETTESQEGWVCHCCNFTTYTFQDIISHLTDLIHVDYVSRRKLQMVGPRWPLPKAADPYRNKVVWWDIDRCPVPDGYNPLSLKPTITCALEKSFGSSPVTILAMGNTKNMSRSNLEAISSSGIIIKHTECGLQYMHNEMTRWASHNPPRAIMMLISAAGVPFHHRLRMFESSGYKFIRGYPIPGNSSQEWLWETLLKETTLVETRSQMSDVSFIDPPWNCTDCGFGAYKYPDFTTHLDSEEHAHLKLPVPQTNTTAVWWDMDTCLIPSGFEPLCVGPSIASVSKRSFGDGPLTIYAFGNIRRIPFSARKAFSSSGILTRHTYAGFNDVFIALHMWAMNNPPPANMVLITEAKRKFDHRLSDEFEVRGYKFICPNLDNVCEEWVWKNLLEETHVEEMERKREENFTEPPWFCKLCRFPSYSYGNFSKHLKSFDHAEKFAKFRS